MISKGSLASDPDYHCSPSLVLTAGCPLPTVDSLMFLLWVGTLPEQKNSLWGLCLLIPHYGIRPQGLRATLATGPISGRKHRGGVPERVMNCGLSTGWLGRGLREDLHYTILG